jgi:hypothetical protein
MAATRWARRGLVVLSFGWNFLTIFHTHDLRQKRQVGLPLESAPSAALLS